VLKEAFQFATLLPPPKSQYGKRIGKGVILAAKMPWKVVSVVVLSLEKIGQGFRATPDFLTGNKRKRVIRKKVVPSNLVSGVMIGTKCMVESIVSAVAGVVIEPMQGAKKGGFKGGAAGFGRGILGLICKPVAGTIDLVTYTARGIGNTPNTMYVGLTKLIRKRKIRRRKIIKHTFSLPPIMPYIPSE